MKLIRIVTVLLFLAAAALTGISEFSSYVLEDHTPPTITADTDVVEVSVHDGEEALCRGITARDNRDGDLSDQVMVEHISGLIDANSAKVTYVVFDRAENAAKLTRYVRYTDYEAPKFYLSAPLVFSVGEQVTLLDRLSVTDVIDGDISDKIRLTASSLTNAAEGSYSILLQATNSLGDTAFLPLTVVIENGSGRVPAITLSDYLVYVRAGAHVDPERYLKSVSDPGLSAGKQPKISDVEIDDSGLDLSVPGVYEVIYSYTGAAQSCKVILTVVVE